MWRLCLSVWVLCVWLCRAVDKQLLIIEQVRSNWTLYRNAAHARNPPSRTEELGSFLKNYKGVYKDPERNRRLGVTDTVILIVQLVQKQENNPQPRMALLNNMICHLERHGLNSMLYLSRYLFNNTVPVDSHFVPNKGMMYIPFPDLSFWNMLVAFGRTGVPAPKQRAKLPYPNFREYGDKAVLFAVLELLELNMNVILLDDDVMLLRDPVPFLINNHITADIVTPEDTRQCKFLSTPLLDVSKWRTIQPEINLGVTFFRSRVLLIQIVRRWMNLVQHNGQKALFPFRLIMQTDNSCHTRRLKGDTVVLPSQVNHESLKNHDISKHIATSSRSRLLQLSICYLSNTLFQNGYVNSFRCGKFDKNPVYSLTLSDEILALKDYFSPENRITKNYSLDMLSSAEDLAEISLQNRDLHILTPVTVHPNYEAKELTIRNYRFWVYSTGSSFKDGMATAINKTCENFSYSKEEWKQMNSTNNILFKVHQMRKLEAHKFHKEHIHPNNSMFTSFFYAAESLPSPNVIFRYRADVMMFEAFYVVPGTFRYSRKQESSADIYIDNDDRTSNHVTVSAFSFQIFGDKRFSLMATLPVLNYDGFWEG